MISFWSHISSALEMALEIESSNFLYLHVGRRAGGGAVMPPHLQVRMSGGWTFAIQDVSSIYLQFM